MRIHGIENLSPAAMDAAIADGGRFVFFECCISFLAFTLRRPTDIVFLPYDEFGWIRGLPYTIASLLLGWWGLPWGLIYTPLVLANNLAGGCDVTAQMRAFLAAHANETTTDQQPCDLA